MKIQVKTLVYVKKKMSSHHRTSTPVIITLALLFLASLAAVSCTIRQDSDESLVVNIDDHDEFGLKWEIFQQWKEEHNKVYTNTDEEKKRYEDFKGNLEYVMERKKKLEYHSDGTAHRVGLNKFADLSNEEFRSRYLPRKFSNRRRTVRQSGEEVVQSCDAPSSLDWRKYGIVTAVKDQGSCGSCWAFSSTGAIEGINALVTGELVSLSEQELVDCDTSNYGCEGGNMDYAFEWVINNGGIDTESDYPFIGRDGVCNITKEKTKEVSINWYVDVAESDSALLCAVVQQPISVGLDGSAIDFQLYTGGIYHGHCSDNPNDIDHAALVVGYGAKGNDKYWIVKNSWGTSWGIDGYFYLKRDTSLQYGTCGVNAMASYPAKKSSPSSPPPYQPPSPPPPPTPPSPPPPPSPSDCGDFFSFCASDETCCCLFKLFDLCLIYGCCEYDNGVCCTGSVYCCPSDYPICDVEQGLCLKNGEDYLGVTAKKRKLAKHKLPWTRKEQKQAMEKYHTLQWKRNPSEAMEQ